MDDYWGDEEIMAALRAQARVVAREEVASLCGLVLARLGEGEELDFKLRSIFGEALRDFGGTKSEPGPEED